MLFLMENAHCATAEDTEQKGSKHFSSTARNRNVFRCVMIVFGGICKGKLKIVTCFARQKELYSLFFCGARSMLRFFRVFPCKCQPNQS